MLKWPVLCLILLGAVDFFREVTAIEKGDVGVCMTKVRFSAYKEDNVYNKLFLVSIVFSRHNIHICLPWQPKSKMTIRSVFFSKKSQRVTFTKYNNKWCGRKKCIVRAARIQSYTETHEQPICCSGFKYQTKTDDCAPLCTTGCHDGRCVAPETCQCDPPSYLDPNHPNTCILPVLNFKPFNSTHNYKCEPGYSINSNFTCNPICEPACVNGECTAPDVCSCSSGYIKNGSRCEPVCNCVNSNCITPDTCSCLDGYSAINSTHCAPVCDGCNGNCVAPNVCECNEGYVWADGLCKPVCNSTCENSYCSGPNECTCIKGYVKNVSTDVCFKADGEGICALDVK